MGQGRLGSSHLWPHTGSAKEREQKAKRAAAGQIQKKTLDHFAMLVRWEISPVQRRTELLWAKPGRRLAVSSPSCILD